MRLTSKDQRLLSEAYEDLNASSENIEDGRELDTIKRLIDNLNGYVEYLEGIRFEEPNTQHEPLSKFRGYLARVIGPGQIGEWSDNKYRKKEDN